MSNTIQNQLVVSRKSLNSSQAMLYDISVVKLSKNQAITYKEAEKIWTEKVCRNFIGNKPAGYVWKWDSKNDKYICNLEKLDKSDIQSRTIDWLMRSIGALVMKGYFKIIPMIKLID
jgi:hypothetical protein